MFGYQICFVIGLIACILATEAKIVYLNGTEISGEQGFTTLSAPVTNVMPNSVSNPQIINNHSGNKTKIEELSFFRRKDAEQTAGTGKNSSSGTITIRDGRQLGLFSMQRLLNGVHLLALLAGIYLMIFVVEPVAVPHHYLAQHYYGLPWGADRRTHRDFANLPHVKRSNINGSISRDDKNKILPPDFSKNRHLPVDTRVQQTASKNKIQGVQASALNLHENNSPNSFNNSNRTKVGSLNSLTSTSRVRYVSAEDLLKRKSTTIPVKIHHWSKWISTKNSTDEQPPSGKGSMQSEWSPSVTIINTGNSVEGDKKKIYGSTGSSESVSLSAAGN